MPTLIKGENDLHTLFPTVAREWHPMKNGDLKPSDVLPNSNKKSWWLGACGHEWEAVISTRKNGVGCPYCAHRIVLTGFNDLATTNPALAEEWHSTKNGDLMPCQVISLSGVKVWWLGKCGHEWQQTIQNRKNGQGCPICKVKTITDKRLQKFMFERGTLSDNYPKLAVEWHPTKNGDLLPTQTTAGSAKLIWWLGKCGHEWRASINNRVKGNNCPYCSNQKVLKGFNDLQFKNPDIAMEWHHTKNGSLKPTNVIPGTHKKVWWLGKCGHEWEQAISKRTQRGQGCPICGNRLQTSFPEQAVFYYVKRAFSDAINSYTEVFNNQMELDIFIPSTSIGIEYDGINWHNTSNTVEKERTKYQICKEKGITLIRIIEEKNTVADNSCDTAYFIRRHPSFDELNSLILSIISCFEKSEDVDVERDSMKIHAQYLFGDNPNSFVYYHPYLLDDWDFVKNEKINPYSLSVSSGIYVWWKCAVCGHEWRQRIATRTQGSGCEKCGFAKRNTSRIRNRIAANGSLLDKAPDLAREWHPSKNGSLSPDAVMLGSAKKVWWKCSTCGYEWIATILSRNQGNGCPECGKKHIADARVKYMLMKNGSLAQNNPSLSQNWNYAKNYPLTPDEVTANSHKKVWWKCIVCGHEWVAEIKSRNKGCRCPNCV